MSGSLTHSPAAILRQLIVDLSLAALPSVGGTWIVFYSSEPDTPDKVITTYDTEGIFHGRDMGTGQKNEHHGAQIRIRAEDEATAFTKARAIAVSLDEDVVYNGVSISGSAYIVYSITRQSGPIPLGKEPNSSRYLFTINVVMAIRQTT